MFKARTVRHALCQKGFEENKQRDHCYFFFHHNGKKTNIYTRMSHGATDVDTSLCSKMARQVRLSGPEFHQFVECPMTADDYLKHIIDSKHMNSD